MIHQASIESAWDLFRNGDLSLGGLGDALLDSGMSPAEVRLELSEEAKYPIPVGYFGTEVLKRGRDEV